MASMHTEQASVSVSCYTLCLSYTVLSRDKTVYDKHKIYRDKTVYDKHKVYRDQHGETWSTTTPEAYLLWGFELTKYTAYLALVSELWGIWVYYHKPAILLWEYLTLLEKNHTGFQHEAPTRRTNNFTNAESIFFGEYCNKNHLTVIFFDRCHWIKWFVWHVRWLITALNLRVRQARKKNILKLHFILWLPIKRT